MNLCELTDAPVRLNNVECAYCGAALSTSSRTKDHVIGRRFVPTGSFANGGWNLILRACDECNGYKANLENDLSAISMYAIVSNADHGDDALKREAIRKAAGSTSARTGKPVSASREELKIRMPLYSGASMTVTFTGPPQFDASRAFELAKLHFIAFMYWLTFDSMTRTGRFGIGVFRPVAFALRSDWGNTKLRAFMDAVAGWEPSAIGDCANGYFRVAIRRDPQDRCRSWAFEWNKNIRVAGFMGDEIRVDELVATPPQPDASVLARDDGGHSTLRAEQRLEEADDKMFLYNQSAGQ